MDLWNAVRPTMWAAFSAVSRLNLMLSRQKYRYVFILGTRDKAPPALAHSSKPSRVCRRRGDAYFLSNTG